MTCICKSGRPQDRCHLPMATEAYRPRDPRELLYTLPAQVKRNQSSFYADRLSSETAYTIDSSTYPTWKLSPRRGSRPLVLLPLLRGLVHDPELIVMRDAFRQIRRWPTEPPIDPHERHSLEQELIRVAATWSAQDLHSVRESFVNLLRFPDISGLEQGLEQLVLTVRTAFPQATMDVLRLDPRTLTDPILIRVLALMPLMTVPELTRTLEAPVSDPYLYSLFSPESHFELLANLGFPRVFAFGVRFGPEAYVIVDYGQDIQLDALEWTERRARDIGASLFARTGSVLRTRPFPSTRPEDRHFLRTWLTRRLNFLFSHLCDLHSLEPGDNGAVDPTPLLKDLLTVKDIVALTQLLATSSDPTVIRLVFFDLIDRFGQLGGAPSRKVDAILSQSFIHGLSEAIDEELLDLRPVLREYLLESWRRFVDGIWDEVLSQDARDARVINVAAPGETPKVFAGADFASRLARVLRNTTHGYHLDWRAFETYLVRHSGALPDTVRELGIALWFCLMACPQKFWPDPGRFTRMEKILLEAPELLRPRQE